MVLEGSCAGGGGGGGGVGGFPEGLEEIIGTGVA